MPDDLSRAVRPAEEADVPVLLALMRELAEYEKLSDMLVTTGEDLEKWLFREKKAEALVAGLDGKCVGYAVYFHNFSTFLGRPGLYLEDIYVTPAARGKGLGKALFRKTAEIALERGCGRMEWACLNWNKPSIDFYTALGAKPMSEWTVYRLEGGEIAEALEK